MLYSSVRLGVHNGSIPAMNLGVYRPGFDSVCRLVGDPVLLIWSQADWPQYHPASSAFSSTMTDSNRLKRVTKLAVASIPSLTA